MKKGILAFLFSLFIFTVLSAQSIEKKWVLENISRASEEVSNVGKDDYLQLIKGQFSYSFNSSSETLQGDYIQQNNILLFFPETAQDSLIRYKVTTLTDSTLVVTKKGITYLFTFQKEMAEVTPAVEVSQLIPNQGFSFNSLWRGVLGMIVLLLIAYLFSNNRKAINWKTIGIGLGAQLLLAIGVLKISFVQTVFEFVGKIFVKILDFTAAGSEFLLGGMMDVDSFGFIFLFQVLPTIIFFSALTSVLFYLGVCSFEVELSQ